MIGEILVTDTGMYVNHRLPCLLKRRKNVNVVKLEPYTEDINIQMNVIDVSGGKEYMDLTKTGYDSWQYQCINNHTIDILNQFREYADCHILKNNLIILSDINVDALYVLDVLQRSEYEVNIHLILPLPFEKTTRGTIQNEILSKLDKVKSLAIYDPYKIAKEKYGDTEISNVERVVNEQSEYLLDRFEVLSDKMLYQNDNIRYFYDFEKESYVETDTLYVLDDYEITHTLGRLYDPYILDKNNEENDYFIECLKKPIPRPDGKMICQQLRLIRKEFAKINGIDYEFRECSYNGPCAGTCMACDKEARELEEIATSKGVFIYPEIRLEDLK